MPCSLLTRPPFSRLAPSGPTPTLVQLANGLTLECLDHGPRDGLAVLLLHGITDAWESFAPVLPHLPAHWRVVVPSQRGHGESDKPAAGYRTADFAADLDQLADVLALPPAVVVGHSMGAVNAARLAAAYPQRVRALFGVGAFASLGDKPDLRVFVQDTIEPLTDPVPPSLAREFQLSTLAHPVPDALLNAMVAQSLKVPAAVWRAAFAGLMHDEAAPARAHVAQPVLLLRGSADAFVARADSERLRAAWPQAQLEEWPGNGHAPHWEEPERFALSLRRFVDQLRAAAPAGA